MTKRKHCQFIIILFLLLSAAGLLFVFIRQRSSKRISSKHLSSTPISKTQGYTASNLGFNIVYPESLNLHPEDKSSYITELCKPTSCLYIGFTSAYFNEYLKEKSAEGWPGDEGRTVKQKNSLVIGGLEATEFIIEENDTKESTRYVYIPKKVAVNGKAITIEHPENDKEYEQVVSSIQFTK